MTNPPQHLRPVYLQPRVLLIWVVTLAWVATISFFSTASYGSPVTGWLLAQLLSLLHIHLARQTFAVVHFLIRKLAHLTEYGMLSLFLYFSFNPRHPESWHKRSALAAVVIAGLYSLADEYHQSFVPGRTASLKDCGLDTLGALLAILLLYAGRRLQGVSPKGSEPVSQSRS